MERETQVQSSVSGANGGVVRSDPEVVAVAKRRQFSMTYKRRIVHAAALCKQAGEIGALLRRGGWPRAKGLYSSHLAQWRKELQAREEGALALKRRGPKPNVANAEARRVAGLRRENARLRQKLVW